MLEVQTVEWLPHTLINIPKSPVSVKENQRVLKCFAVSQNTNGKSGSKDFSLTVQQLSWRMKKKTMLEDFIVNKMNH